MPGNADQIEPLADAGVLGFKAFLCHSGIDEFPNVGEADLRLAMPILARRGLPLLAHAELVPDPARPMTRRPTELRAWLDSRPESWEVEAIRLLIALCRETRCRVHIVHLAAASALPLLAEARAEGLPLTVETCPHYLTFAAEEIPDGDPRFKCAPPIRRARESRSGSGRAFASGTIDTIGNGPFAGTPRAEASGHGRPVARLGRDLVAPDPLPAVWTRPAAEGSSSKTWHGGWPSGRPPWLACPAERDDRPGPTPTSSIVDPEAPSSSIRRPSTTDIPATPYEGRGLIGRVIATYLRGSRIAPRTGPRASLRAGPRPGPRPAQTLHESGD